MNRIFFDTEKGKIELEYSDELRRKVASANSVPPSSVTDMMILRFFQEASNVAIDRASTGYVASDDENS